jgi:hypothetical protein
MQMYAFLHSYHARRQRLTRFFSMVNFLLWRLRCANMCPASYILEVIAFVAALISLMTGTSVLIIYDTCYAHEDILEVRHFLAFIRLQD